MLPNCYIGFAVRGGDGGSTSRHYFLSILVPLTEYPLQLLLPSCQGMPVSSLPSDIWLPVGRGVLVELLVSRRMGLGLSITRTCERRRRSSESFWKYIQLCTID